MNRPQKVVAYIVRDGRLLVFVHADDERFDESGVQVPAGTVRDGELPEHAVLREAFEETGLSGLRVERYLGAGEYDARPYVDEIHVRHYFHLATDSSDVPERWITHERGDGDAEPIRFELYWIPLARAHVVGAGQAAFVGRMFDRRRLTGVSPSKPNMYDAFAEEYLRHASDSAYNAYYDRPAVLAALGDVRGLAVLDLGCGPGLYAEELVARGARRVVGVDASATMVRLAAERVAGPVDFRQHDLQTPMTWAGDEEFDAALMPLVLHHLDDRVAALREVARVLRPGGRLVLSTSHPTTDWLRLGASYFTVEKVHERWKKSWDVAYWRQPLDVTCDEFRASGLLIERVHEPRPSAQLRERYPEEAEHLSIAPAFIVFSLVKAPSDIAGVPPVDDVSAEWSRRRPG